MSTDASAQPIVDYAHWDAEVERRAPAHAQAAPFPHSILEGLLRPETLKQLQEEFPGLEEGHWTHYRHVNEFKAVLSRRSEIPESILGVIDELNGRRFRALLERLTGVSGLVPDPEFEAGGGLSLCGPGGFLNVHTDFTVHPLRPRLRRRVNLILYLNDGWDPAWGGATELWDRNVRGPVVRVAPCAGTSLVFNTDPPSFHGHPDPIRCPEGVARHTLALYYFTEERSPRTASTDYRPRPADGAVKRLLIYLDKLALRAYYRLKLRLGIRDAWASRVLKTASRIWGKFLPR